MTTEPAGDHTELERRLADVMRQQHELVGRLQHGQQYFQRLARSVWRVQEEERRRLARDLHDGIGQNLTAIMHLLSQSIAALPPPASPAREHLEKTRALAEKTLAETRELSRLLRPQILDDLGLEAALRWLARTAASTHALDIRLDLQPPLPALDGERNTLVFRVVQEALTNVARHAQAQRVDIMLREHEGQLQLRIDDDGRGCDGAGTTHGDASGSGIGGMRDRVRLFDGAFEARSQPGAGFSVIVALPLPAKGDRAG